MVIADRLEGTTVEEFTLALAERWKIGRKDVDNGFVLAVSIQDRKWRLEVGRDLQGTLSDAATSRLMRENLVPAFRAGRYGDGLLAVVTPSSTDWRRPEGRSAAGATPGPRPSRAVGLAGRPAGPGDRRRRAPFVAARRNPRPWKLPQVALGAAALAASVMGAAARSVRPRSCCGSAPRGLGRSAAVGGAWLPLPLGGAAERGRALSGAWILAVTALAVILFFTARSGWTLLSLVVTVPFGFAGRPTPARRRASVPSAAARSAGCRRRKKRASCSRTSTPSSSWAASTTTSGGANSATAAPSSATRERGAGGRPVPLWPPAPRPPGCARRTANRLA